MLGRQIIENGGGLQNEHIAVLQHGSAKCRIPPSPSSANRLADSSRAPSRTSRPRPRRERTELPHPWMLGQLKADGPRRSRPSNRSTATAASDGRRGGGSLLGVELSARGLAVVRRCSWYRRRSCVVDELVGKPPPPPARPLQPSGDRRARQVVVRALAGLAVVVRAVTARATTAAAALVAASRAVLTATRRAHVAVPPPLPSPLPVPRPVSRSTGPACSRSDPPLFVVVVIVAARLGRVRAAAPRAARLPRYRRPRQLAVRGPPLSSSSPPGWVSSCRRSTNRRRCDEPSSLPEHEPSPCTIRLVFSSPACRWHEPGMPLLEMVAPRHRIPPRFLSSAGAVMRACPSASRRRLGPSQPFRS